MKENNNYFAELAEGVKSLMVGMKTSMKVFLREKTTEEYPENRDTLVISERFSGELSMPHNEKNEHKCVGCGLCEMACPNGTIKVNTMMEETSEGKRRKVLSVYEYNLSSCMFCQLCVTACPHDAILFINAYEQAVFDKNKLHLRLNNEGSKLMEKPAKPKPAPAAAAAPKPTPASAPADAATPIADATPANAASASPILEKTVSPAPAAEAADTAKE